MSLTWFLVVGGVLAFFFLGAFVVIGRANRRWLDQQARHLERERQEPHHPHDPRQPPLPGLPPE